MSAALVVLVAHGFGLDEVTKRARALAAAAGTAFIEVDPTSQDLTQLATRVQSVSPTDTALVVHVVGGQADLNDALHAIEKTVASVSHRFPTLDHRNWVLMRSGQQIDSEERSFLQRASAGDRIRGVAAIPSATRFAVEHSQDELDSSTADLVHALAHSALEAQLGEKSVGIFAAATSSIVWRIERVQRRALVAIEPTLEQLLERRPRDAGAGEGRRWVVGTHVCPPFHSHERDSEESLMLTGSTGSLLSSPGARVRALERTIDEVDPGRWPEVIAAAIDAATSPQLTGVRSPLAAALEELEANVAVRARFLTESVEKRLREYVGSQRNLHTGAEWARGAAEELREGAHRIRTSSSATTDLSDEHQALRDAVRWLPYSSAMITRGLLLVVTALVLAYAYAPVGIVLAKLANRTLPSLGDDLIAQSRIWARILGACVAAAMWLWWEVKWSRAVRRRRHYIRAADQHLRGVVASRLDQLRIELLVDLAAALDGSGPGSAVSWIAEQQVAAGSLLEMARSGEGDPITATRLAAVTPSLAELDALSGSLSVEQQQLADTTLLAALTGSPWDVAGDQFAPSVAARVSEAVDARSTPTTAHEHAIELGRRTLSINLTPSLDSDMDSHPGAAVTYYVVAGDTLKQSALELDEHVNVTLHCHDRNFAAGIWLRRLHLRSGGGSIS